MTGDEKPEPAAEEAPKAPPAPAEAPPEAPVPEGWEEPSMAMDQDDLDAKVTVNVETVFSEITMVKLLGTVFFQLAGLMIIIPVLYYDVDIIEYLPSVILAFAGMACGAIGFYMRSMRKYMIFVAPALLIAAMAVRPLTSTIGSLDTVEIILALAFAITWFLAIEYLHALDRFVSVGEMAIKRRLTNFNLSGVVKHFLGWGFLMLGIVVLVTIGIIGLVPLMGNAFWSMTALGGLLIIVGTIGTIFLLMQDNFSQGILFALACYIPGIIIIVAAVLWAGEGLTGESAELWSVFGIAMAAAVIFVMFGLILTVWYMFAEGVTKVEKVEYSREKLQEMLASGQVLELEGGTDTIPGGGERP